MASSRLPSSLRPAKRHLAACFLSFLVQRKILSDYPSRQSPSEPLRPAGRRATFKNLCALVRLCGSLIFLRGANCSAPAPESCLRTPKKDRGSGILQTNCLPLRYLANVARYTFPFNRADRSPFQGSGVFLNVNPGRCPWATLVRPVGTWGEEKWKVKSRKFQERSGRGRKES